MKYIKRYADFAEFESKELVEGDKAYVSSELPGVIGIRTDNDSAYYNKDYDPQDIIIDED